MRAWALMLLTATSAQADLPPHQPRYEPRPPALEQVAAPCLRPDREKRYVVTWWIEDKATGEKRAVGSQEVRQRC